MKKISLHLRLFIILLFIVSLAVAITINCVPLYYLCVKIMHLNKIVGLTVSQLMNQYVNLLIYLDIPWIHHWNTTFSHSAKAMQHFSDVKKLFMLDYFMLIITSLILIKVKSITTKYSDYWRMLTPLRICIMVIISFIFLIVIQFNNFFILFHKSLFFNDDWLFNPQTDPIIKVLPETFFMLSFVLFLMLVISLIEFIIFKINKKIKSSTTSI